MSSRLEISCNIREVTDCASLGFNIHTMLRVSLFPSRAFTLRLCEKALFLIQRAPASRRSELCCTQEASSCVSCNHLFDLNNHSSSETSDEHLTHCTKILSSRSFQRDTWRQWLAHLFPHELWHHMSVSFSSNQVFNLFLNFHLARNMLRAFQTQYRLTHTLACCSRRPSCFVSCFDSSARFPRIFPCLLPRHSTGSCSSIAIFVSNFLDPVSSRCS